MDRLPSENQRHQAYTVLAGELERPRRLVEGLLDFGRFEAGAAAYHLIALEIGSFLKTVVAEFQERVAQASTPACVLGLQEVERVVL